MREDGARRAVEERVGALDPGDRHRIARARPGAETPVATIDFETGVRQQVINRLASFPIWTPGTCQLKLMVKIARDPDFRPLVGVLIMLRHSRS
jgi:hypothetical protein